MDYMGKKSDYFYHQSSVVPFRIINGNYELLLITTRKGKWIFPKGIIEPGLDAKQSAVQEALEEAGVKGKIYDLILSEYEYEKWEGVCKVKVFPFEVEEVLETWQEDFFRKRKWFDISMVEEKISNKSLKKIIREFQVNFIK